MSDILDSTNQKRLNQNLSRFLLFSISAKDLKSKIDSKRPLMIFDIGERQRYEKEHIPGSLYAVCNEESKKKILPKLSKDVEIVLVADNDEHTKQMAEMMHSLGLKVSYLQGGIKSWNWDFTGEKFDKTSYKKNISAFELKKNIDKRQGDSNNKLFLLDVREPDEYAEWHIENSVNIPLGDLTKEENLSQIPKDKEIITICPHGNRATDGRYMMERHGYNVKVLEGGLIAWSTAIEQSHKEFQISDSKKVNLVQIRRIGKGCISYIIESDKEIAVIDPVFPIDNYLKIAESKFNANITKVFDTHQHADHISAAKALALATNAKLYRSSYEQYEDKVNQNSSTSSSLSIEKLSDGNVHKIGSISLKVIHTPGHTPGSLSFDIEDKLFFTGDTLFVDGIGRPDLRDKAEEFAGNLYNTIHEKILQLPDDILVLPAHFEKDVKTDKILASTIGEIKKKSQFLATNISREEFIKKISSKVTKHPPNYKEIISINKDENPVQLLSSEIFELEMGPNRCSISA
ncbi:MAG TPA: rhodanese-like domain-containing protein [Nitrososphaeraceae archaeon]|nr:rhodanese-like domain-containing protein [Nitrososphaeraceae archaeon]